MKFFIDELRTMLGSAPQKWSKDDHSQAARDIHTFKQTPEQRKLRIASIHEELGNKVKNYRWRIQRWASIIIVNMIFVLSYWFDVQLVEGALTASRFVGFHLADLNSALQVVLAYKVILINLVIGVVTVLLIWWFVGGRSFCSWVCPYHLLAEIAEMLHIKLVDKGIVKDHPMRRSTRTVMWVVFAALAFITGYTVFETVNPVGILSRSLIYGAGFGLVLVAVLLLIEIFYSRRFWCRYICPIGLTYGFVGSISPVVIRYDLNHCLHEGECRNVCMVPHVLEMTKKNRAHDEIIDIGADCTRCAMCLEVCPTGALNFKIRGTGDLI
ncbi:MAG: NapH/MauN family ferredoxin-type protein [bacterium]|nr:NapH/MauN family ferredoxin-type protein [bacterium]